MDFENLTIEFHVLHVLNAYQISFKSDISYFSINKFIFYTQF